MDRLDPTCAILAQELPEQPEVPHTAAHPALRPMRRPSDGPRLYGELAGWFHLLTAPEEYAEEAATYRDAMLRTAAGPVRTLLELGSGGGNNAFHLKRDLACTLTDLSPEMLELSRGINPECEHVVGDMRTLRLGRTFDAVLVHDAIMYMTEEEDLRCAIESALCHCRPGGTAVFAPDYVRETFRPGTETGGHDGDGRALRYLEWTWDPDPDDTTYTVDYALLLREGRETHGVYDRHVEGLFSRATWLELIGGAGFRAHSTAWPHAPSATGEIFVAFRP